MGHYYDCSDCGEERGHMPHCKWHWKNREETCCLIREKNDRDAKERQRIRLENQPKWNGAM